MMGAVSTLLLALLLSPSLALSNQAFIGRRSTARTSPTVLFEASKQAEYGTSIDWPETYVRCGKCMTHYAITEADLGERGKGRRLECSVCSHSWFQSKDRLMHMKEGFEMVPLPEVDLERIQTNIEEGKSPKFLGETKLYVGNIAFECHENDILEVFSRVGTVGDVSLVRDEEGRNRGFGFVTMRTEEEGEKAIAELDGIQVRGRNIAVRESNN